MNSKLQNFRLERTRRRSGLGFSVMEVLILIAVMGVLGTVAVSMLGGQFRAAESSKLVSDVTSVNNLISAYVADGGNLTGLTSPQAILDKMKKSRADVDIKRQHTGAASGRLVDTRLKARTSNLTRAGTQTRAVWNIRKQRFELSTAAGVGVEEFYFDESLSGVDFGVDTTRKAGRVKYNSTGSGWIWGNTVNSTVTYNPSGGTGGSGEDSPFNPADEPPTPPVDPDPGDGSGGGDGGGDGEPGGGSEPPVRLAQPIFVPSGSSFAYASFPSTITISGAGVAAADGRLEYQKNGGGWITYDGSAIPIVSGDSFAARNVSLKPAEYITSYTASSAYYRLTQGFTGNSSGTWGNATGGPNLLADFENGATNSTFRHGDTRLDLGDGEFLDAGTENVLTFTRQPFDTITPNTWFALGDLVMLNGTTFNQSEADGVTLSLNLNISNPAQTGVIHINFGLISTENTSDRTASADIVELRNPNTDFTVTVDGVTYRLELGWQTLDPGAGIVQGNQFLIYEGSSAQAQLRARFVPTF